jgi:hypothetical protein
VADDGGTGVSTASIGVGDGAHVRVQHMPRSWAILPMLSMWPRQELIVQFVAEQAAAHAKAL